MSGHIPGEWRLCKNANGNWWVQSDETAEALTRFLDEDTARLIAAAPDLLEACEHALTYMEVDSVRELLKAAIAKATGEKK